MQLLRSDSSWKSTHALLVKLIRLMVETGTITSTLYISHAHILMTNYVTAVVSIIFIVLSLAPFAPPSSVYGLAFVLGKVYSNAMMVNFNHRIQIINGQDNTQITSFMMPPSNSDHLDS